MRTTFYLASGSIGRISACLALAVLAGCSASGSGPSSTNNGSGGQTNNSSSGGQSNSSSGGSTQNNSSGGTSSSSQGGSNTNNPQGGTTSSSSGGNTNNPQGGTTSSSNGGNTNAGGSTAGAGQVMCTNTDKSIIPINSDGWVDKTCNACGIQGAFYWYADDNTKKSLMCNGAACVANKPPYQTGTPGPGMCISGTTTGSKDDWGAGIDRKSVV